MITGAASDGKNMNSYRMGKIMFFSLVVVGPRLSVNVRLLINTNLCKMDLL